MSREVAIALRAEYELPFWIICTVVDGVCQAGKDIDKWWSRASEDDLRRAFTRSTSELPESSQQREWEKLQKYRSKFPDLSLGEICRKWRKKTKALAEKGVQTTTYLDTEFPVDFLRLYEPPSVLWSTRPIAPFFQTTRLAVIGSRQMTYYGERATKVFVRQLAGIYGLVIVSGCAQGVDWLAHQTTLAVGGLTIGFLGCGINQMVPQCRWLSQHERAVVISEFPPDSPTSKWRFPFRNRLIAAAAKGVLVMEAGRKSGTLLTTAAAVQQNKDVMVLTQPWDSPNAYVFQQLSRDGARVIVSVGDVMDQLGLPHLGQHTAQDVRNILKSATTPAEEQFLQELIRRGGRTFMVELTCPPAVFLPDWEKARLSLEGRGIIQERLGVCTLSCMIQS